MLKRLFAVAAFAAAIGVVAPAGATTLSNGGFEGGLTGWTVDAFLSGPWSGDWTAVSGAVAPISGFAIVPPPEGTKAAVADQNGPSSLVLYQDIAVGPDTDASHSLQLTYYYFNRFGAFVTPPTLEITGAGVPNQQFRIDLMKTAAGLRSVAAADVIANLVETPVGSPLIKAPTTITKDLTALAGQTVRLRAAVADTLFYFQAGLDAVSTSSLKTNPALLDIVPGTDVFLTLSATLSGSGPVSGRIITFKSGGTTLCTGTTDSAGVATCGALPEQLQTLTTGVTAEFGGAADLPAVSDSAPFAIVAGTPIL